MLSSIYSKNIRSILSKTIALVTGSRAEFGLLRILINEINLSFELNLKLLVTGTHLSKKHGETISEIYESGFKVDEKVFLDLDSDNTENISKASGLGINRFSEIYKKIKPDLLVVLGDRYEILSAVIPACFQRIPIAHIHGGEVTEGAIDEAIRHSITKFSHLHFVANEKYRKRVIQLGENPSRVFNFGGMSIDAIQSITFLNKKEIEEELKISFLDNSLLITFHPETLDIDKSSIQLRNLLRALTELSKTTLIFTMPNADPGSNAFMELINKFVSVTPNAYVFKSLGQKKYFSLVQYVDGVIGNSSSGITQIPYFKKATINIGDRQKGRMRADSIIDCNGSKSSISLAIQKIYTREFQLKVKNTVSPYGNAGCSKKIVEIIKLTDLSKLIKKSFYDLN